MGDRGPPKTPTAVLERRGSRRAEDRVDEPKPNEADLTPPEWLEGVALKLWNELAGELSTAGVLKQTDRLMFAMLCETYREWRTAIEPGMKDKARAACINIAKQFGLTPSARAGIHATPPKENGGKKSRTFKLVG